MATYPIATTSTEILNCDRLKIKVVGDVMPRRLIFTDVSMDQAVRFVGLLDPDNEAVTFFRNVSNYLPVDAA